MPSHSLSFYMSHSQDILLLDFANHCRQPIRVEHYVTRVSSQSESNRALSHPKALSSSRFAIVSLKHRNIHASFSHHLMDSKLYFSLHLLVHDHQLFVFLLFTSFLPLVLDQDLVFDKKQFLLVVYFTEHSSKQMYVSSIYDADESGESLRIVICIIINKEQKISTKTNQAFEKKSKWVWEIPELKASC